MQFAEKIVDRALRKTGSTWITQEDLEKEMARSNTGTMNDIIYGVKDKFLVSFKMGNGMTAYSTKHFHNAENTICLLYTSGSYSPLRSLGIATSISP